MAPTVAHPTEVFKLEFTLAWVFHVDRGETPSWRCNCHASPPLVLQKNHDEDNFSGMHSTMSQESNTLFFKLSVQFLFLALKDGEIQASSVGDLLVSSGVLLCRDAHLPASPGSDMKSLPFCSVKVVALQAESSPQDRSSQSKGCEEACGPTQGAKL